MAADWIKPVSSPHSANQRVAVFSSWGRNKRAGIKGGQKRRRPGPTHSSKNRVSWIDHNLKMEIQGILCSDGKLHFCNPTIWYKFFVKNETGRKFWLDTQGLSTDSEWHCRKNHGDLHGFESHLEKHEEEN